MGSSQLLEVGLQNIFDYCKLQIMKHINREEIVQRRKEKRVKTEFFSQKKTQLGQCVDKQMRQVGDQTIDRLIKSATKKRGLTQDDKLDIIHVIASKTGVHLNRNLLVDYVTLDYCPQVMELSIQWEKSRKSYFVLKGSLLIYEQIPVENREKVHAQTTSKVYKKLYDDEESQYLSHQEFQKFHTDYHLIQEIPHFRGVGLLFKKGGEEATRRRKLIAINAILVCIDEPPHNMQAIFHDGITHEGKIEILNQFPVLKAMGKKIKHFIKFFNVRKFSFNDTIYKTGSTAHAVYFIIKGQIKFQHELALSKNGMMRKYDRYQNPFLISTETIGESNYFGEEEVLAKSSRFQTAKCKSSKCVLLQFQAIKFMELMRNNDFNELITRIANQKKQEREYKIERTKQMLEKQSDGHTKICGILKEDVAKLPTQPLYLSKQGKGYAHHNDQNQKIKWMHGHVVKKQIKERKTKSAPKRQPISMHHVNPDHYQATRKKYRKFSLKTVPYESSHQRDTKNIWKTLKLQDIIRQQQVAFFAPEGRKYYDCSKRLQNQLKETRSIRPKTASTTYQTKLQYLAYLQQFNH